MGMLVNGTWLDDDPLPADRGGAFPRPDSSFRDGVSRNGSSGFEAEHSRYLLLTAPSCPWAHRTVLMRALQRLGRGKIHYRRGVAGRWRRAGKGRLMLVEDPRHLRSPTVIEWSARCGGALDPLTLKLLETGGRF